MVKSRACVARKRRRRAHRGRPLAGRISARAVMAGGTVCDGSSNDPAISHLDFDAIDAAFPEAVAACT